MLTLESLQMPTVEYKEINMEDYSRHRKNRKCPFSSSASIKVTLLSVPALSMQIVKPAAFTGTSHYPLLLLVYVGTYDGTSTRAPTCIYQRFIVPVCSDGTPGGQVVTEQFHMDWATVLVSSFGAVVVRCDGRGSGFQGTNLLHRVQKRLGVFEEQDQKDALRCVALPPCHPKVKKKKSRRAQ